MDLVKQIDFEYFFGPWTNALHSVDFPQPYAHLEEIPSTHFHLLSLGQAFDRLGSQVRVASTLRRHSFSLPDILRVSCGLPG